ncbi:MAG: DUF1289 domain-containing protein [Oleiphilaceae bacterium]|nr:DUF1289 domain-containing protein [Oleiphilaceae bacterium]
MKETASHIESPCIRQCCLDDQDICMGCYRHVDEICAWQSYDATTRARILAIAEKRRQEAQSKRPNWWSDEL